MLQYLLPIQIFTFSKPDYTFSAFLVIGITLHLYKKPKKST